jgi:hypothetical protein
MKVKTNVRVGAYYIKPGPPGLLGGPTLILPPSKPSTGRCVGI